MIEPFERFLFLSIVLPNNFLYLYPDTRIAVGSCKTSVLLFLQISDVYAPLDDGVGSQHFISKSYDATSHFETTCKDVLDIFKRGTGEEFDFSKVKHTLEDQE